MVFMTIFILNMTQMEVILQNVEHMGIVNRHQFRFMIAHT